MRGCVSSSVPQMASSAVPGWAWSNHTHQPAPEVKKHTSSVTIEQHRKILTNAQGTSPGGGHLGKERGLEPGVQV